VSGEIIRNRLDIRRGDHFLRLEGRKLVRNIRQLLRNGREIATSFASASASAATAASRHRVLQTSQFPFPLTNVNSVR